MNYKYTSIKVIDGKIKAVVNKEVYPNYRYEIFEWQQKHEIFEFANYNEHNKMFCELVNITGKQGIEVTCIEIKEGFAWFKEEKEYESEFILCAANYYNDNSKETHTVNNIKIGFVICGRRHHNCISIFAKMYGFPYSDEVRKIQQTEIQGFITNTNRFVTRLEALEIARNANQIITGEGNSRLGLFSEDLY